MTEQAAETDEKFPFRMLARVPYRPDDFQDWRAGILGALRAEKSDFHIEGVVHE